MIPKLETRGPRLFSSHVSPALKGTLQASTNRLSSNLAQTSQIVLRVHVARNLASVSRREQVLACTRALAILATRKQLALTGKIHAFCRMPVPRMKMIVLLLQLPSASTHNSKARKLVTHVSALLATRATRGTSHWATTITIALMVSLASRFGTDVTRARTTMEISSIISMSVADDVRMRIRMAPWLTVRKQVVVCNFAKTSAPASARHAMGSAWKTVQHACYTVRSFPTAFRSTTANCTTSRTQISV